MKAPLRTTSQVMVYDPPHPEFLGLWITRAIQVGEEKKLEEDSK